MGSSVHLAQVHFFPAAFLEPTVHTLRNLRSHHPLDRRRDIVARGLQDPGNTVGVKDIAASLVSDNVELQIVGANGELWIQYENCAVSH
ncbi:hypothetical protein CP979_11765 [Streptomyces filamentosus]|nr:hypothetical protein CP979_11765 [Streptomyces filamentosus]